MDQSFFTAAVGAAQQQKRLNIQANNIANVNTYGFKAKRPAFSALMYNNQNGIEGARLPKGTGALLSQAATDFASGAIVDSGGIQDYAIVGQGFFGLYDPATGEVAYTRDGSFTFSQFQRPMTEQELAEAGEELLAEDGEEGAEGVRMKTVYMLSDGLGRFVLNNQGSLIEVTDQSATQPVGVFDFSSTDGMLHMGDNRFVPADKNGQVRFGSGQAVRGKLEASNADLGEQMVKVIEAQRSFSYALRMVQTSDELETTANNLRS